MKKAALAVLAALLVLALVGCSVVNTPPDREALWYSGGMFSAKKFQGCIDPSTRETKGPGEKFYEYPTRQVSYDASNSSGAEHSAFKITSKDGADMYIPVSVTFQLKTDCATLRKFHETLGLKYSAYWGGGQDSSDVPEGWIAMLNFVIGKPLDASLGRITSQYNWQEMRSNPKVKAAIDSEVNQSIEALVTRQAGGEFFTNFQALTQKPDPKDPSLLQSLADKQKAITDAETARLKADKDLLTARAQRKVALEQAKTQKATIAGFGSVNAYICYVLSQQGLNCKQPTYLVNGTKP